MKSRNKAAFVLLACFLMFAPSPRLRGEGRFSGFFAAELRAFFQDPESERQFGGLQPSLILSPEYRTRLGGGAGQLVVAPFLRIDSRDPNRSHFDMREFYWRYSPGKWEILLGMKQVFWGVTESRHLVDIVNQHDLVEDLDGEDKLGQPMVRFSLQQDWGNLSFFLLPGFRERSFPSEKGRPGFPLPVDVRSVRHEHDSGNRHTGYAFRYSHFLGNWDIGASFFHGTGREPALVPREDGKALIPSYSVINQIGLDLQYTSGAWLWKFEGIAREGQGAAFAALVGGFEYSFYQLFQSADLGLLFEVLYDGRDGEAPATFHNDDLFFGTRLALNDSHDTQLLAGALVDRKQGSTAVSIELERRIAESFKVEVQSRLFRGTDPGDILKSFTDDSFLSVRISWFF